MNPLELARSTSSSHSYFCSTRCCLNLKDCDCPVCKTITLCCKAVRCICDLPPERFGHKRARCFNDEIERRRENSLLMKVLVLPIHKRSARSITTSCSKSRV